MAFCDLEGAMSNAEKFLKYVVTVCMDRSKEDLEFFEAFYDKKLSERLRHVNRKFCF